MHHFVESEGARWGEEARSADEANVLVLVMPTAIARDTVRFFAFLAFWLLDRLFGSVCLYVRLLSS